MFGAQIPKSTVQNIFKIIACDILSIKTEWMNAHNKYLRTKISYSHAGFPVFFFSRL